MDQAATQAWQQGVNGAKMSKRKVSKVAETGAEYKTTRKQETKPGTAVYFLEMSVENVRCFGPKQTLDLRDSEGRPARWTVILGNNGVGKTTLLKCLAGFQTPIGLHEDRGVESDELIHFDLIRPEGQSRGVWSSLYQGDRLSTHSETAMVEELYEHWSGHAGFSQYIAREKPWCMNGPEGGRVVCYGYGASRRLGSTSLSDYQSAETCASLFDDENKLINAEEWLLLADYAAASGEAEVTREQRLTVIGLLLKILPDVDGVSVGWTKGSTPRPFVRFDTPYGLVPLTQLSLGYQTLIAWMVDLAWRLFDRYPNSPDPLAEPGIVLVDEIDLHLHPKWQRSIMSFLTERFPNAQFIVTAHSPLVVQASEGANLVLLKKEGDHVVIDNDVESIAGWRADQILTSELFGLESARPPRYAKQEARRRELLAKSRLTKKDREELEVLEEEAAAWPTAENPKDIEAMRIIREAADHLKKKGKQEE